MQSYPKFKKNAYLWSGTTQEGKKIHGEIQAFNPKLAKLNLLQQGINTLSLRKKNQSLWRQNKKIPANILSVFYRQLATLITAGIPLTQGLGILLQSQKHSGLHTLIQTLKTEVETGNTLATALHKQSRQIDFLTCHLIHVAEQTGTLDKILVRIANDKEKLLTLNNKIQQALFYPAIVFLTAIIITMTMLTFVIPRFADLFASFQAQLPAFTLTIIHISHALRHPSAFAFIPLLSLAACIWCFKKFAICKNKFDSVILRLPIIGIYIKKTIFARFARTLATIFAAGMPIIDGLKILTHITRNQSITQAIHNLTVDIAKGQRLYQAMQNSVVFPPLLIQMVKIGEEAGSLEQMLTKTAEFYEMDIDYWINNFSRLLEPLIIIVLGVLIGGLVIAMYLPIFKLGTVI